MIFNGRFHTLPDQIRIIPDHFIPDEGSAPGFDQFSQDERVGFDDLAGLKGILP